MSQRKLHIKPYVGPFAYQYYLDGLKVNGKRKRLFFRSRAEAKAELERLTQIQQKEGQRGLNLNPLVRELATQCAELLSPYSGKTILDATRFYVAHLEATANSVPASTLVSEYLESKHRAQLSPKHLEDLKGRLAKFNQSFGWRALRTITTRELEDWLHNLKLSPQTINNYRAIIRALFGYATRRELIDHNPVEAIQKIKIVSGSVPIFAPETLQGILDTASQDARPAIAIGAFAGLRTAELLRLDWDEIDLERGYVEVTAQKAKTAKRRLVEISANLRQWLSVDHKTQGKLYPLGWRSYHEDTAAICRFLGLAWPQNGLRHSFASYHLALYQNAPALALEMGQTSPRMIFDHYREVVTREEAEKYWAIRPKQTRLEASAR
jgi:integrase